jgi:hypothetical protein
MKKKVCKLLSLCLALILLAGCGGQTAIENTETLSTTEPSVADTTSATQSSEEGQTEPSTTVTEPSEVPDITVAETPFSLGTIKEGVYISTYLGVGCKLDSAWQFYSAQELQALPENTQDTAALSQYAAITDMMAENATEMKSLNVQYTRLSMAERIAYADMDDDTLLDNMLQNQMDLLISSYTSAGYQVKALEKKNVTFLGEQRVALYTEATTQGTTVYILQIFDYALGQFGATFTFKSFGENKTEEMLPVFFKQ